MFLCVVTLLMSDGQYVLNHGQHLLRRLNTLRLRRVDLMKVTLIVQILPSIILTSSAHEMLWKARKMMEMQRLKRGLKDAANKQVFGNCSASVTETKKVSHVYSQLCWVLCKWEINVISTAGLQTHICSLLLPFHQEIIVLLQQCWSSALITHTL